MSTATEANGTDRIMRRGVWLLAAAQTIVWATYFYSSAAFLFVWETALPWTKAEITLAFTLSLTAAAVVSPLSGRLIDAGRGAASLAGGAVLGGVALAGLPWASDWWLFALLWSLIGAACGFCLYDPCFAFVARTTGRQARAHITRITLVAGFAGTICFPAAAILTDAFGWQAAVLCFAAAGLGLGAPMMFLGARMVDVAGRAPVVGAATAADIHGDLLGAALRRPEFWLIMTGFAAIAMNRGVVGTHIVPLLVDRGLVPGMAVAVAASVGPMQVVGRILMVRFGTGVASITLAVISFAAIAVAPLFLFTATTAGAWVFAALFGMAFGLISILKTAVAVETFGARSVGVISGWLSVPYLAGFAVAPVLGSGLWAIGGYDLALVFAIALAVLALVTMLALGRARRGLPGQGSF